MLDIKLDLVLRYKTPDGGVIVLGKTEISVRNAEAEQQVAKESNGFMTRNIPTGLWDNEVVFRYNDKEILNGALDVKRDTEVKLHIDNKMFKNLVRVIDIENKKLEKKRRSKKKINERRKGYGRNVGKWKTKRGK